MNIEQAITPVYLVKGAEEFLSFCTQVLGAQESSRVTGPDSAVMRAELRFAGSAVIVTESIKDPPTAAAALFDVQDCDAMFERAVRAGAKPLLEPRDMPWGHRWARIEDRWGNRWTFATRPVD
jgi:PhnB protein